MEVLVKAANYENFLVVTHRLRAEEFFWFLEGALTKSLDLIGFSIEVEAVRDPTIVTSKYENF